MTNVIEECMPRADAAVTIIDGDVARKAQPGAIKPKRRFVGLLLATNPPKHSAFVQDIMRSGNDMECWLHYDRPDAHHKADV